MFRDRQQAGELLAKALERYRGDNTVVLALPRGGVVLGHEVAQALTAPLDIVVSRKIGHPLQPEYAIGAVDDKGTVIVNEAEFATVDSQWLEKEAEREQKEAKRRIVAYRGGRASIKLQGKIAVLVDDGIATGLTMRLAVKSAKAQKPKTIVVAVPVSPRDSIDTIRAAGADKVIVLEPPEDFLSAVGAHYERFEQVEDDEVVRLLQTK